jgi:hypothetical protein
MLSTREPLSLTLLRGETGPDPSILGPVRPLFEREWLQTPPFLRAAHIIRANTGAIAG